MNLIQTYGKELVSLAAPFITWALARFFKAKAKLTWSTPFAFTYLIQEPRRDTEGRILSTSQTVYAASHLLKNAGSETAKKVEITFNWKPPTINVWPSRHFTTHTHEDKRFVVIFDSLAPNESVRLEVLSVNNDLPGPLTVRSEQCQAKVVEMLPQPVLKPWLINLLRVLIAFGVGAVVYLILLTLQFLIVGTRFGVAASP